MRVGDDRPRHGPEQPALEYTVPAVAEDNQLDLVLLGRAHDLLRGMTSHDAQMHFEPEARRLTLQFGE